jgi:hypothetical protein
MVRLCRHLTGTRSEVSCWVWGLAGEREPSVRRNSKLILPYEPGYTGHWEMEKRRKETREWLRKREQEVMRARIKAPSIVPESDSVKTTTADKDQVG